MLNLSKQINDREWVKIGKWIQAVLFAYSNISGRTKEYNKKILKWDFAFHQFLFLDWEYQFEKSEFEEMKKFFLANLDRNPMYFREYEQIVLNVSDNMINFSKKFLNENYTEKTNKELRQIFSDFYETVNLAQPVLEGYQLMGELLEEEIRFLLSEYLKKQGKEIFLMDEYLKDLNIPKKKIPTVEEVEELLKIACKIQKNNWSIDSKEAKKILEKHIEKYRYMNTHHFLGDPDNTKPLFDRLDVLLKKDCQVELEKYNILRKKEQERLKELTEELAEEKDLLTYIDIAQDLSYLKPYRVDAYYIAWINFRPLFEEIGKRCGATVDDLMALNDKEIEEVIDTNAIDKNLVAQRKEGYAIVKIDGEVQIVSGGRLEELQANLEKEDYSHLTEVKGNMAFKGILEGRVKVLHSEDDIENIEEGDIMVIAMTDPNYIPAMEKASAFVTDYGGILCHAAIIAREMAKPCVIGTKIATQVFKDGDIVEVDANNGVVRKI